MKNILDNLFLATADKLPNNVAIKHKGCEFSYAQVASAIRGVAGGLNSIGLERDDRVAVYLSNTPEAVISYLAAVHAGGVFVPVNPLLKTTQVGHILTDCDARILVTTKERYHQLKDTLKECLGLQSVILVNCGIDQLPGGQGQSLCSWQQLLGSSSELPFSPHTDTDMAAIFYTSGSTGKPKGVVLSHQNMVAGAESVSSYLQNNSKDRLLVLLPFSFDYGFSQLSTAFLKGATVVLMDYLLPRDVVRMIVKEQITGLAGVPSLWNRLAQLEWPPEAAESLRYMTNSGGAMPSATLNSLCAALPKSEFFLMYGLTEAFRSTYLPSEEISSRPGSIGKAIPNVEVMVVRKDGSCCAVDEPGELVHRGPLVAMGYWNDPVKTAERFKPAPGQDSSLTTPEIAVWSGDMVKKDEDGYLYFMGRNDDMIKTSGYRVSPTEVEEEIYASELVGEVVCLGLPHPDLGQAILVIASPRLSGIVDGELIIKHCKTVLPNFMVPLRVEWCDDMPRNPNGKIDRPQLRLQYQDVFS